MRLRRVPPGKIVGVEPVEPGTPDGLWYSRSMGNAAATSSSSTAPESPRRESDDDLQPLIESLRQRLGNRPNIELVLLFGSRARGEARQDSDVDLAVLGRDIDVLELYRDLSLAAGVEVDVVDLGRCGYPLLKAVLRDSKLVHEGRRGAWGRWRSHTIARLELDRPWFERMRDAFLRRLARTAPAD